MSAVPRSASDVDTAPPLNINMYPMTLSQNTSATALVLERLLNRAVLLPKANNRLFVAAGMGDCEIQERSGESRRCFIAITVKTGKETEFYGSGTLSSASSGEDKAGAQSRSALGPSTVPQPAAWVWWENQVYNLLDEGRRTDALMAMYLAIEDLFGKRNLEVLNKSLQRIDISRLDAETAVSLLRVTYRARKALAEWPRLLEKVRTKLADKNVPNWERLLVGL
jgi:hypothetical protein